MNCLTQPIAVVLSECLLILFYLMHSQFLYLQDCLVYCLPLPNDHSKELAEGWEVFHLHQLYAIY